jgi:hypothetical protein
LRVVVTPQLRIDINPVLPSTELAWRAPPLFSGIRIAIHLWLRVIGDVCAPLIPEESANPAFLLLNAPLRTKTCTTDKALEFLPIDASMR